MTESIQKEKLEKLYEELSALDEKEIFCIEAHLLDKLESIRKQMIPFKKLINDLEGEEIYPLN